MGRFSYCCSTSYDFMPLINFIYAILLLLTFISPAHATYPATIVYYVNTHPPLYSGAIEACDGYISTMNNSVPATHKWIKSDSESSTTVCKAYYRKLSDNSPDDSFNSIITKAGKCGNTVTPNVVTCEGEPPPPPCSKGCTGACGSPYKIFTSSDYPPTYCINGCNYDMGSGIQGNGSYWIVNVGNNLGTECTTPQQAPTPPGTPCPVCDCLKKGQSFGTVNGAVVCTAKTSPGSQPTISVTPGKTTTNTPPPTPENPNPTPVTTQDPPTVIKTTPAPAGSPDGTQPTVTSGSANPDGSTTSTTESKDSFCSKNPASEQCQAKSLCEKNPDAPTCKNICEQKPDLLICKQTDIDQLCKENPDRLECKKADDIIGKKDDLPNENLEKKEIKVGDNFNFNPVNIASNATCPSPQTIVIAGSPMTVSYDWICAYASAFRPLVIAFALFLAYGIIAAAIRSDAQSYQRGLF